MPAVRRTRRGRPCCRGGFILDVPRNYTTYATYYRLTAVSEEVADEEVDVRQAASAIRRYVAKNPALIRQKAAIIVEHFRTHMARHSAAEPRQWLSPTHVRRQ